MAKKFKKLVASVLVLSILATFCVVPFGASAEKSPLKFGTDGKFKIVIFSDVQDQYPVHQRVVNMMRQAIEREKPDFIVFTGDITELNIKDPEDPQGTFVKTLNQLFAPVVEANIPYAIVFGNHDNQSYYSGQVTDKDAMLRVYQTIGDCRTTDPAPELTGTGTCKIPIYSSNGNDVAFNLWMVDSNTYEDPIKGGSYDNPHADQLAWIKANNDPGVNSLLFQHIPMPEIYNLVQEDSNGEKTYGDKKYALKLNSNASGYIGEYPCPCPADKNTGEFQTLKEMGNVLGVFTGHDHLNDFTGTYDGIDMIAVPGMSYFNYGQEAVRGYGVIELDENNLNDYSYNTVKFKTLDDESGASSDTTTYDKYDVIEYSDLKENGNKLGDSYAISGGHNFTYDATSPSKSAIFKFRWTAGSKPGYQFSFDIGDNGNISHPFGVWIQRADQAAPNGAWLLKPNKSSLKVNMDTPVKQGETYDIEVGRLKVLTGEAQYIGQYYVYLKVNGVLIQQGYSNVDEEGRYVSGDSICQISNTIRFGGWGNGGDDMISQYVPIPEEEYYSYDVVTYDEFLDSGKNPLSATGTQLVGIDHQYDYKESAEAAETHSAVFKFRWTMENDDYFQIHLGHWGGSNNFAYRLNYDKWNDRATGKNVDLNPRATTGTSYDFEIGRIKVKSGKNAGKYYSFFKVDGNIIFEKYVFADDTNTSDFLQNSIYLGLKVAEHTCFISATPGINSDTVINDSNVPEEETVFEKYDVVTYEDLLDTGNHHLAEDGSTFTSKNTLLHYDVTSETHSVIYKFRWVAGTATYFQMYPGVYCTNPFQYRVNVSDAQWVKRYDPASETKAIGYAINEGDEFDIEIARLKIASGENAGKYLSYFKVNGEEIFRTYVSESDISDSRALDDTLQFATNADGASFTIKATPGADEEEPEVPEEPETPVDPNPDSLYYDYDEVTYDKLTHTGGSYYTYNATSSSFSSIIKFRWTAGGDEKKFTLFLDDWVYPFCFAVKTPNQEGFGKTAGPNGSWHLVPSNDSYIVDMDTPIVAGQSYDIEVARLKVKNGENAGKYHVYAKVNGELIKEYYYDGVKADGTYGDGTALSSKIILSVPSGNTISAIPVAETYEQYDEIGFDNLYIGSESMAGREMDGSHDYTYNATSPTYSVKFKYRWTAGGDGMKFSTYFDEWKYPFCFAVKTPNQYGFGATAGPNGSWHLVPSNDSLMVDMDTPIVAGQSYDIEIGRLKVATGANAGKYYVYFMVDGKLIQSYYYDGVVNGVYDGVALSNKIIISAPAGNKFSSVPYVQEFEDYDEIGIEDLRDSEGNELGSQKGMQGATIFTYDKTSATSSVIFKYRWKIGEVAKFQLSFDKSSSDAMSYMFGAWLYEPNLEEGYPNGRIWLRPSFGPQVILEKALLPGSSHNVEFARLMVKNGPNKGKYYVYLKIDDVLIAENYVDVGVVDTNGNYSSNGTTISLSNEILFTFWGSNGNSILAYREPGTIDHEGLRGDLDNDGVINAVDLVILRKILFGAFDTTELPEGVADFNNDGNVDILDLVTMKNYLLPEASYSKTGSLTLGMQEHLLEDETKTAEYIADVTATMGASAYRLSTPIHQLYYATSNNEAAVNESKMAEFKNMVAALKAKGINEILYVTDSYILPFGYANTVVNHNITIPDPENDLDNYTAWLKVNSNAFKALAEEVPEIKFFEPFNEINLSTTRFEKYGIGWEASADQQAAYKFTVAEKAGIMADLCYYISEAVKSVDPANQVTTPSMATGINNSIVENNFIEELYKAIESGNYPRVNNLGDVRVDNYFTIINVHGYASYKNYTFSSQAQTNIDEWADGLKAVYDVAVAHNDGASRVWLTETGMTTFERNESKVAKHIELSLKKLDQDLTFIDSVFFYKIADISTDRGASGTETYYGLFYSGDDLDNDPYAAKPSAKTIYSYFHNGTTNYSELTALVSRYSN